MARFGLRPRRLGLLAVILLSPGILLALLIAVVFDVLIITVKVTGYVLRGLGRALVDLATTLSKEF